MKVSLKSNHCLFMQQVLRFLDLKSSISESCFSFQSSSRTVLITVHSLTGHCIMVSSHPPSKKRKQNKTKKKTPKIPNYSLVFHARISKYTCNEEGCYVDFFLLQVTPLFEWQFLNIWSSFCSLKTEWKKDTATSFSKEDSLQKVFPPNGQYNMFQITIFLFWTNKIIIECLLIDATCITFRYRYMYLLL